MARMFVCVCVCVLHRLFSCICGPGSEVLCYAGSEASHASFQPCWLRSIGTNKQDGVLQHRPFRIPVVRCPLAARLTEARMQ